MTTPSIEELISAYIDGELDSASAATVRDEIACSPRLQELERSLKELSGQFRNLPAMKPGRDFSASILERLDSKLTPAPARTAREPVAASFGTPARRSRTWLKVATAAITTVAALILAMVLWNPQAFWGGRTVASSVATPESTNESPGDMKLGAGVSAKSAIDNSKGLTGADPAAMQIAHDSTGTGSLPGSAPYIADGPYQPPLASIVAEPETELMQLDASRAGAAGGDSGIAELKQLDKSAEAMKLSMEGGKFDENGIGTEKSNAKSSPAATRGANDDGQNKGMGTGFGQNRSLGAPIQDKSGTLQTLNRQQGETGQSGANEAVDQLQEKPGEMNSKSGEPGQFMALEKAEDQKAAMQNPSLLEADGGSGFGAPVPGMDAESAKSTSHVFAVTVPAPGTSWNKVLESMTGEKEVTRSAPGDRNVVEVFVFEGTDSEWKTMIQRINSAEKDITISMIKGPEQEQQMFGFSLDPEGSDGKDLQSKQSRQEDFARQISPDSSPAKNEGVSNARFLRRFGDVSAEEQAAQDRDSRESKLADGGRGDENSNAESGGGMGAAGGFVEEAGSGERGELGSRAGGGMGGGGGSSGSSAGVSEPGKGGQTELAESEGKRGESYFLERYKETNSQLDTGKSNETLVRRFLILSVAREQSLAPPSTSEDK